MSLLISTYVYNEAELPQPQIINNVEAANILEKAKGMEMGFDQWSVCYSNNGRVIFYNSPGLLAYSVKDGDGSYYGAIDFKKIDCGYMTGETITMPEPSPDGNFVTIWNWDVYMLANGNSNVYIYNLQTNKAKVFSRDSMDNVVGSWSNSSQYYAYGDNGGKYINIYDTRQDKSYNIPFCKGPLKQVFVSDSGDVLASADKNYIIHSAYNGYSVEELPFEGELLGFTKSQGIVYFEGGSVYEYNSGVNTLINNMGDNFKLVNRCKFTGVRNMEHPVFSDNTTTIVYDMDKKFYSYSFGYNNYGFSSFSDDLKKCFVTNDFTNGIVITSDGETANIKSKNASYDVLDCTFLDNSSLIRVSWTENSTKLDDFALVKTQLNK